MRAGLYPKASLPALGGFVITFCIPALLLRSLSQRRWAEVANLDYLAAYALGSLAVLAALRLVGPVAAPLQWSAVLMAAAPMLCIYPILGQRYGRQAVNAASMLVATVASFGSLALVLWALHAGWDVPLPPRR